MPHFHCDIKVEVVAPIGIVRRRTGKFVGAVTTAQRLLEVGGVTLDICLELGAICWSQSEVAKAALCS